MKFSVLLVGLSLFLCVNSQLPEGISGWSVISDYSGPNCNSVSHLHAHWLYTTNVQTTSCVHTGSGYQYGSCSVNASVVNQVFSSSSSSCGTGHLYASQSECLSSSSDSTRLTCFQYSAKVMPAYHLSGLVLVSGTISWEHADCNNDFLYDIDLTPISSCSNYQTSSATHPQEGHCYNSPQNSRASMMYVCGEITDILQQTGFSIGSGISSTPTPTHGATSAPTHNPHCRISVSFAARTSTGGSWTNDGQRYQIYDITVTNTGSSTATAFSARSASLASIDPESWNYNPSTGAFSNFGYSLEAGSAWNGAGFIYPVPRSGSGHVGSDVVLSVQC